MMDMLTFYLVEEAIKLNHDNLKRKADLLLMIWERVRIELNYIKNLQEWSDSSAKEKENSDDPDLPQIDIITLRSLGIEGLETAAVHQQVYNSLMSDDGPYVSLKNNRGLRKSTNISSEGKGLQEIEEKFTKYNQRRLYLISEKHKRKQSIEDMKATVSILETEMSNRSRLAVSRRAGQRGHRKVDAILNRLSLLRRHIETETCMLNEAEIKVKEFVKDKNMELQSMLVELEELARNQMLHINSEMRKFIERLSELDSPPIRGRRQEWISNCLGRLANETTERLIAEQWKTIERKAKSKKAGHHFSLQDLFSASGGKERKSEKDSYRAHIHDAADEENKCYKVKSVMGKSGDSTSGHTLIDTFYTSSEESLEMVEKTGMTNPTRQPSQSSESSGTTLETIFIPADRLDINKLPPPFPIKEFCAGKTDDEDSSSAGGGGSENATYVYDTHNVRLVPSRDYIADLSINVCLMRNVRVIADHDYNARKQGEISFSKGQVIKQKLGENEDGFCYGWIRESKLTSKIYGWYPSGLVSLFYQENQP